MRTLAVAGVLALSAAGHWREGTATKIPLQYYQGIAAGRGGQVFFDGVFTGLYRTGRHFGQQAGQDPEIPPAVTARYGFNHIGDIGFDGRVLLPLECFTAGRNTCGLGAIAVADPVTLAWRYLVLLDRLQIAKAMWVEPSPDGRLLWTSSGRDLLAYRAADVSPAHADQPIRAVRRLRRAVPRTGVTGATFFRGRLLLAGQRGSRFEVWSVNLRTGRRRLEIRRRLRGESEGLAMVRGALRWIVTPFDPAGRPPTYPGPGNALLKFRPVRPRPRRP